MPLTSPKVYSIVAHYCQLNDTIECIESLLNQDYGDQQVVFVDNGSQKNDSQIIKEKYPNIISLRNDKNLGFAGGYNVGIRFSLDHNPEYIFIVNNDVVLAPNVLSTLVNAFNHNKNTGVVSPIIYHHNKPNQLWSAGGKISKLTLDMVDNHGRGNVFFDIVERDFLSGCAMMLKVEVLKIVGLFDEDYYLYYEDYDLSFRIKQAGYKQLLVPQARIWHKVSKTSGGEDNPIERYYMARSSILFYRKHARPNQWFLIIPHRIGSAIRTLSRLIQKKKFESARYFLTGLIDGVRQIKITNFALSTKEKKPRF